MVSEFNATYLNN